MNNAPPIDELLRLWREGEISEEEMRELTARLATKEGRETLRQDWFLEAALPQALQTTTVAKMAPRPSLRRRLVGRFANRKPLQPSPEARAGPELVGWSRAGWPRRLAAVAGLLLLAGGSIWLATQRVGGVEIEVVQLGNANFAGTQASLREHERAQMESLDLRSGEAHLRLSSDVKLVLSGPTALRFIDPMHATVLRGKVTVDVGPRGKGFILDTPVTRVVDLGTQFGVEAQPDGHTDVMVIKGNIELFGRDGARRTAKLEQGEAVRVDAKEAPSRIVNITGSLRPGEWSTQPPPSDCNIVSMNDNFGASEGYHFYRIVPRGFKPGAVVYTNRPYVWEAPPGQAFPSSLADADVVQTFFGEFNHTDYAIQIVVARPTELFVIMPQRGLPPAWLTPDFERTGEIVVLRETGKPSVPHPFEVWKRAVREAGEIKLGPPSRDANGHGVGMYGIAAKSL
jgi:ferric-dicitrate binding protein FerR (iron transport regulator)